MADQTISPMCRVAARTPARPVDLWQRPGAVGDGHVHYPATEELWAEHGWGLDANGAAGIVAAVLALCLALQLFG